MKHATPYVLLTALFAGLHVPAGAAEDPRFEQVRQDVAMLLRTVREQDRKIERSEEHTSELQSPI